MSKQTAEETTIEATDEVVDVTVIEDTEQGTSVEDKTKVDETSTESKVDESTDEVVVTIGDDAPPQEEEEIAKAPEWVRELRKSSRELSRKNKELERQLADRTKPAETAVLGPKPTMADANIDYDAAKFEEALTKWNDKRRAVDNESAQRQATEQKAQEAWQARLSDYSTQKAQLKVKDFSETEAVTSEALNATQQGIIIQGADNAALVIHALGKNPTKLKELAAITDPVKFAFAVAKLEKDLKVTTRKAPPPPEKTVTGSAPKSGVVDSQLERLRAEAEKTGNYTKVTAYNRQKRKAS
jgi:hypothetical protein